MATLELEARLDNLLSTAQEETKDIDLFAPITEKEECPMCLIPLPYNEGEIMFHYCCGKRICNGCCYKEVMTELEKGTITEHGNINTEVEKFKCAYCRQPPPKNNIKALKKLMKKNNTQAFIQMADRYESGEGVFRSDTKALEMYICAAELGCAEGYLYIGRYYAQGIAVEEDISKALLFFEIAAKKGSVSAHHKLAMFNGTNGNIELFIKHLKVVASAGHQGTLDQLMSMHKDKLLNKYISKDDLTQTLRAFQASSNELRNKDRDEACEFYAHME